MKKSVDKASLNNPKEGAVLTYTFSIANEGNTTLRDINLVDSLSGHGLSEIKMNYPDISKELKPGSTMTATATYTLTAADIKAGRVLNSVYVNAKDPSRKGSDYENHRSGDTYTGSDQNSESGSNDFAGQIFYSDSDLSENRG